MPEIPVLIGYQFMVSSLMLLKHHMHVQTPVTSRQSCRTLTVAVASSITFRLWVCVCAYVCYQHDVFYHAQNGSKLAVLTLARHAPLQQITSPTCAANQCNQRCHVQWQQPQDQWGRPRRQSSWSCCWLPLLEPWSGPSTVPVWTEQKTTRSQGPPRCMLQSKRRYFCLCNKRR